MKILLTSLLVLAFPLVTHAQEATGTGSSTGSGTHVETAAEIFADILGEASELAVDSADQIQVPQITQLSWEKDSKMLRQRMANQRTECRDAVRRANRDQRLTKILQCQRALLLLETNLLRKEQIYLTSPRLTTATVNEISTTTSDLVSAMMTIVDGIDAGLFTTEEQYMTARTNLRETYRAPYWLAKSRVRVDRELTYVYFIVKKLSSRNDTSSPALTVIATCLEEAADLFMMAKMASASGERESHMLAGRSRTATCQEQIRNLATADRQAASDTEN